METNWEHSLAGMDNSAGNRPGGLEDVFVLLAGCLRPDVTMLEMVKHIALTYSRQKFPGP